MKQTEHFGLCLRELSDLVRMEDFNRDNTKIDDALAALAQGGTKLFTHLDYAGSATSAGVGIPVQNIGAWKDWDLAALFILPRNFQGTSTRHALQSVDYEEDCGVQFQSPTPAAIYLFFPEKDQELPVRGAFLSTDMVRFFQGTRPFGEVSHVNLTALPSNSVTGRLDYIWAAIG